MLRTSILFLLVGCGQVDSGGPNGDDDEDPAESLEVTVDSTTRYVRTGERQTIEVSLARVGVTGPVTLEVADPPPGLAIEPVTIDGDRGELVIDAAATASFARNEIEIVASAGDVSDAAAISVEVIGVPGGLDPTFGTGGVETFAASDKLEIPLFAIAQGDRVVLGIMLARGGKWGVLVVRREHDGSADPTFGITGVAGETFLDLSTIGLTSVSAAFAAAQPDGQIVIAGSGSNGSNGDPFIVRLTANGQLDPSLALRRIDSTSASYSIRALTLGPSGEIVLAGTRSLEGNTDALLVRLDSTGALDLLFGDGGIKIYNEIERDQAHGVVVQRDGRIVAMISTSHGNQYEFPQYVLRRFGSDGRLDANFGNGGKAALPTPEDFASGVSLQSPDGLNLIVAGSANLFLDGGDHAIWRFLADGRLDLEFAGGVGYWMSAMPGVLRLLEIGDDGSLYAIVEDAEPFGEPIELDIFRLEANGVLDPTFGTGGRAHDTIGIRPQAVALRDDYRLTIAGAPLIPDDNSDTVLRNYWR